MAVILGKFNGGTNRASLASVLGQASKRFRQFSLYADPANGGSVYVGGVDVTSAPLNDHLRIAAGASINLGPQSNDRPFIVDTESWYVVGSAAGQILYLIANTDDGGA